MTFSRKEYYYKNRETILQQKKDYRARLKTEVLDHYGNICSCCGESAVEFLSIDHIDGNGNKHKKEVSYGSGGANFYIWLKKNNYPSGFRVLCHNCNQSLGYFGYCPHGNL
jgi:RNase P subunit RPR2